MILKLFLSMMGVQILLGQRFGDWLKWIKRLRELILVETLERRLL